jgi:hypothetical protein
VKSLRTTALAFACLAALAAATPAVAQAPARTGEMRFGIRAGVYSDAFVGADLLIPFGRPWYFNPNVEIVLGGREDIVALSADVMHELEVRRPMHAWVGAGPAILFRDHDRRGSDTTFGLNIFGGIGWDTGGLTPYAQLKIIAASDSELVFGLGLRF